MMMSICRNLWNFSRGSVALYILGYLLYAKTDDSLLISADIFNEFTPDSILNASFGTEKPKLYAIGKFSEKEGTVYLMSKAATAKQKVMFIAAYNKKNEFLAAMPVMKSKKEAGITTSVTIDKLFNINKKRSKTA